MNAIKEENQEESATNTIRNSVNQKRNDSISGVKTEEVKGNIAHISLKDLKDQVRAQF